jgi:hypothetical protein
VTSLLDLGMVVGASVVLETCVGSHLEDFAVEAIFVALAVAIYPRVTDDLKGTFEEIGVEVIGFQGEVEEVPRLQEFWRINKSGFKCF